MPDLNASSSLWLVFLAGLSVGGLSCIAVQGGLLAAAVAHRSAGLHGADSRVHHHVLPAVEFVGAKIVAYTLFGAFLGWAGHLVTPRFQGGLQIAVGILMVLMVLQLFNVHPALRYLTPRPPKAVQRFIRQRSKDGSAFTPVILGALTVLIPCSITIGVEGLAIASHDVMRGALIMLAFTLGTAPLFLGLATAGGLMGKASYAAFKPVAAVLIVAMAGLSMVSGARLLGWSGGLGGSSKTPVVTVATTVAGVPTADHQEATINVTSHAYVPARLQIKAGVPTKLHLLTQNAMGCIRSFTVPAYNLRADLPTDGEGAIDLPAAAPGEIVFTCSMGMYSGVIEVVQ